MARCRVELKVGTVRFEEEPGGERELLNGPVGLDAANRAASAVHAAAIGSASNGASYVMSPAQPGLNRAHALVYPGNGAAMRENARQNTLLRALNSARI